MVFFAWILSLPIFCECSWSPSSCFPSLFGICAASPCLKRRPYLCITPMFAHDICRITIDMIVINYLGCKGFANPMKRESYVRLVKLGLSLDRTVYHRFIVSAHVVLCLDRVTKIAYCMIKNSNLFNASSSCTKV